jgi:broad specificity phosphatase PhoE
VAAVEQAIGDATVGDVLAIITHGVIIRMVLGHYMGAPASSYRRMRVDPGSVSILSFGHTGAARVTAINWRAPLTAVLAEI